MIGILAITIEKSDIFPENCPMMEKRYHKVDNFQLSDIFEAFDNSIGFQINVNPEGQETKGLFFRSKKKFPFKDTTLNRTNFRQLLNLEIGLPGLASISGKWSIYSMWTSYGPSLPRWERTDHDI